MGGMQGVAQLRLRRRCSQRWGAAVPRLPLDHSVQAQRSSALPLASALPLPAAKQEETDRHSGTYCIQCRQLTTHWPAEPEEVVAVRQLGASLGQRHTSGSRQFWEGELQTRG